MPYKLVKDYISRDVIEALEILLGGAKRGDVTGIAFVCTACATGTPLLRAAWLHHWTTSFPRSCKGANRTKPDNRAHPDGGISGEKKNEKPYRNRYFAGNGRCICPFWRHRLKRLPSRSSAGRQSLPLT
jgi:hypothetical protein